MKKHYRRQRKRDLRNVGVPKFYIWLLHFCFVSSLVLLQLYSFHCCCLLNDYL